MNFLYMVKTGQRDTYIPFRLAGKVYCDAVRDPAHFRKLFLVMRLTSILLMLAVMQVTAASSEAQKISFQKKDATLLEVLQSIGQQTGYFYVCDAELLRKASKVNIAVKKGNIYEVLAAAFRDQPLTYTIHDKMIVVKEKSEKTPVPKKETLVRDPDHPELLPSVSTLHPGRLLDRINLSWVKDRAIRGKVTDEKGEGLPGVNIILKGTQQGTTTDGEGNFTLNVPNESAVLTFSFVGYLTQEIEVGNRTVIDIALQVDEKSLEEVVVVGYGTQKKSNLTGAVASLNQERLEMMPNLNIAQAIQGSIPGVVMSTSAGGAVAEQSIMVRGRNSILASNSPLIVVDGIPYSGSLKDLNPNDVKSIDVLKDASAAAIYGSRGANGVILITTKLGTEGKPKISYNGYYSLQRFVKLPDLMNGQEFYDYKMERGANLMTASEKEVYESGQWVDWLDLATRNGNSTEHNISVSGATKDTKYYISGGILNVKGLAVNDDYLRVTTRINLDSKVTNWLTLGTRTQLSYDDRGGVSPTWSNDGGVFSMNPLTKAYDANGKLTIYPWVEDPYFINPLQGTLALNTNETNQAITNNYAIVELPFIPGFQYRINAGFKVAYSDTKTYYGRNTATGLNNGGSANTNTLRNNTSVIENIVDYNREFGKHSVFLTGVYSFQSEKGQGTAVRMLGFPHDFLSWYSVPQAQVKEPTYSFDETILISQMLRVNYAYNNRYLLTLTGRRDGYSGFGSTTKWGIFPSVALGWNLAEEDFFQPAHLFNELKVRASYGLNGNQAIGAYQTISRLTQLDYIHGTTTMAGYIPNNLGVDNLGWESTRTFNAGIDFGILSNRVTGDINYFNANTYDLLLNRSISPVHGFTTITQNIGKTKNQGLELAVKSRNLTGKDFKWTTDFNATSIKNRIVSLYGELDENGKERDDVANSWFINHPIQVNYGYVWEGIWQENEIEEATRYGTKPGFVKIKDTNGDGQITADDRQIVGQRDPRFLWGLANTWTYKNLSLSVFIHGVHGVTRSNPFLLDDEALNGPDTRRNISRKNFWTPENPNTDHPKNENMAWTQAGQKPMTLESANFIRVKDITMSYDLAGSLKNKGSFSKLQIYFTGRNLFTITKWTGLDPELGTQQSVPLQKELVFGLNLGF